MVMTIVWQINDGARAKMYQCCWNFPGNDVSGMVASSEKYAGTCEKVRVGIVVAYCLIRQSAMETALFGGGAGCSVRLEMCVDAERTGDSTEDDHKS